MIAQFSSIGLITLLGAMLPGPDFAVVTKNSLLHSRISGYFTSLGIGAAILVHMSYCVWGLALVIANSFMNFALFKTAAGDYVVKVNYNEKPVTIPDCSATGCTLAQFMKLF